VWSVMATIYRDSEGSNGAIDYISPSTIFVLSGVVSISPLSITNAFNETSAAKRVFSGCIANDISTIVIQMYSHEVQFRNATIYAISMSPALKNDFRAF
jgi:hypothetical protein